MNPDSNVAYLMIIYDCIWSWPWKPDKVHPNTVNDEQSVESKKVGCVRVIATEMIDAA
jgi:hypothetical protein